MQSPTGQVTRGYKNIQNNMLGEFKRKFQSRALFLTLAYQLTMIYLKHVFVKYNRKIHRKAQCLISQTHLWIKLRSPARWQFLYRLRRHEAHPQYTPNVKDGDVIKDLKVLCVAPFMAKKLAKGMLFNAVNRNTTLR